MSKENMTLFTKKVEENDALKAELVSLGTDNEAIAKFAQENGFDITKEDLEQADTELSDTDLDDVAGGALRRYDIPTQL